MLSLTVERVAKHSFIYSYMLSQPFSTYMDAYPILQNEWLLEVEQLKYGEHGELVRILQEKLNFLSYYKEEIDGDFGVLTEHALKQFQSDHDLYISGEADGETLKTIIIKEINMHMEQLKTLSSKVHLGMNNKDVEIIQKSLQYFGYYEGSIDGIYGPLTKRALEIAEGNYDLELVQEVPEQVIAELYEEEKEKVSAQEVKQKEETHTEEKPQTVEQEYTINASMIDRAYSLIGTPYVWGGDSPGGFDCSGFIQFLFAAEDKVIPRTVSDTWNFASPVEKPSVGDLVFFETYQPGPSHMGLYVGDGQFIHASESKGVAVAQLKEDYWTQRYLGAKRVY